MGTPRALRHLQRDQSRLDHHAPGRGPDQKIRNPARAFEFWSSDEEFYRVAAKTPRSNCVMDTSKLLSAGIKMRPVEEALEDSLRRWRM